MPKTKVFVPRSEDNKIALEKSTFGALLQKKGLQGKLDDVGLYNWGTKEPREIVRALCELHGCTKLDDDPLKCELDPACAVVKFIHEPKPWQPNPALELEKTHTIEVKRRLPVPAVSLTSLKAWFDIGTEDCAAKYVLEGLAARASKVDFEVHATGYYDLRMSAPVVVTQPKELVAVPCDTQDDKDSTHVFQSLACHTVGGKRQGSGELSAPAWKGASQAKHGVLKGGANVNSSCAPYQVLVRYYKDDADRAVKLLLHPFNPTWKHATGAPLDDDSLVVRWEVKGDARKRLKRGRLLVYDKADKIVFFAALDATHLQGGAKDQYAYDLVKDGRKKWDRSEIKRDAMPYRVAIEAHSDEAEENGLAVAVKPTLVRDFAYKRIQFIAFDVKPGTRTGAYLGHVDPDADIAERCGAMKQAITIAQPQTSTASDVLKVFMAPEFYFRGQQGGYPVEKLSTIVHAMREETDKVEYRDWLFVFGTTIGYLLHETGGNPTSHGGYAKLDVKVSSVDDTDLTDTKVTVASRRAPTKNWKFNQSGSLAIKAVSGGGPYVLTLDGKHAVNVAAAFLEEPLVWIESSNAGNQTKVTVDAAVTPGNGWKLRDAANVEDTASAVTTLSLGRYELTLAGNKSFKVARAVLVDTATVEHGADVPVTITAADQSGSDTKLTVQSTRAPATSFRVKQAALDAAIGAVAPAGVDTYTVTLVGKVLFANAPAVIVEPVAVVSEIVGAKADATIVSSIGSRVLSDVEAALRWRLKDSGTGDEAVAKSTFVSTGKYTLTLVGNKALTGGLGELVEPKTTEVFNAAQIQRGFPMPHVGSEHELEDSQGRGFRTRTPTAALIYKEAISWIDFIGPNYAKPEFRAVDGSGRVIYIHDPSNRKAIPTSGSGDTLGANPNRGTEITRSGYGGGSVLTMDGVTFAIEVCLDHNNNRVGNFYGSTGAKVNGDPKVQVHLIPSWGSSIGGGIVSAPPNTGLVFNVDGQNRTSVARLCDGAYYCDDHPNTAGMLNGYCQEHYALHWCGTCQRGRNSASETCLQCTNAVTTYRKCAHTKVDFASSCTQCDNKQPCGTHGGGPYAQRPEVTCSNAPCARTRWAGVTWPPTCPSCTVTGAPAAASLADGCANCWRAHPCMTHTTSAATPAVRFRCGGCNTDYHVPVPHTSAVCAGCTQTTYPKYCEQYYAPPTKCAAHSTLASVHWKCVKGFQPMGAPLAVTYGPQKVAKAENATYFEERGYVKVFEVKPIPDPWFV